MNTTSYPTDYSQFDGINYPLPNPHIEARFVDLCARKFDDAHISRTLAVHPRILRAWRHHFQRDIRLHQRALFMETDRLADSPYEHINPWDRRVLISALFHAIDRKLKAVRRNSNSDAHKRAQLASLRKWEFNILNKLLTAAPPQPPQNFPDPSRN